MIEQVIQPVKEQVRNLPESPGVYEFRGSDGALLYIGKSKNLRRRIQSHLRSSSLNGRKVDIRNDIALIRIRETAGELGALLLELWRIKKELPLYNRRSRRTRLLVALLEEVDGTGLKQATYQQVSSIDPGMFSRVLGVFRNTRQVKQFLDRIQRDYFLCPRMLGLERGEGACFYRSLEKCQGVCIGKESVGVYNARFDEAFKTTRISAWPFPSPITLTEERENQRECFTIDHWCLTDARAEIGGETRPFLADPLSSFFDYDVYRILFSHIMRTSAVSD